MFINGKILERKFLGLFLSYLSERVITSNVVKTELGLLFTLYKEINLS